MKWKVIVLLAGMVVGFWFMDDINTDVLKGKRVLVTGASTGIGEQLAYTYARMGASLVITARREARLQEVVARCRQEGREDGHYHYIVADMSDLNDTERVVKEAVEYLGGLDFLVLNHVHMYEISPWKGTPGDMAYLDKAMRINFFSYVHLTTHALPHLISSNGSVVVVSSMAGKLAQPLGAVYSSSKFALEGFFSSLRQEMTLRGCDVSVTLCILGFIDTESIVDQMRRGGQDYLVDYVRRSTPQDAALAIVKGGASRSREIYFPHLWMKSMVLIRDWFPSLLENNLKRVYTV